MAKDAASPKGFENVAKAIAKKSGVSMDRARAILASRTRGDSEAAKKKNPNLLKVPGA